MKSIISFLLSLLICYSISAQSGSEFMIQWQKSYGGSKDEAIYSIIPTDDGGFIGAGYTDSDDKWVSENKGYSDIWIVKFDRHGVIEWEKTYGGSMHDYCMSICKSHDGGYVAVGSTRSDDGDIPLNQGELDWVILKIDAFGNLVFFKTYGGSEGDVAHFVQPAIGGGYIVCGYSMSDDGDFPFNYYSINPGYVYYDAWFVKFNESGDLEWSKVYGGTGADYFNEIMITNDGNYLMIGKSSSRDFDMVGCNATENASSSLMMKVTPTGDVIWQKCYFSSVSAGNYIRNVCELPDGSLIGCGTRASTATAFRFDSLGNLTWSTDLIDSSLSHCNSLVLSPDNQIYSLVSVRNVNDMNLCDIYLYKGGVDGNFTGPQKFGGSRFDSPNVILETNDNGLLFAAISNSYDGDVAYNNGGFDSWIVKLIRPHICGTVFHDENFNGILDAGEAGIAGQLVMNIPGPYYTLTDNDGNYSFNGTPGLNEVIHHAENFWINTGHTSHFIMVHDSMQCQSGYDFGIHNWFSVSDVGVDLVHSPFNPGVEPVVYVSVHNYGTTSKSGTVSMNYNPALQLTGATPAPDIQTNGLIQWNYGPIGAGVHNIYCLVFDTLDYIHLGDTYKFYAQITPVFGDNEVSNNNDSLIIVVNNPWDVFTADDDDSFTQINDNFVSGRFRTDVDADVKIFPNPFSDWLMVLMSDAGNKTIVVADISGKKVLSCETESKEHVLDLLNLDCGIYFLSVYSSQSVVTLKIIKQ
jgi:hypothetical protein